MSGSDNAKMLEQMLELMKSSGVDMSNHPEQLSSRLQSSRVDQINPSENQSNAATTGNTTANAVPDVEMVKLMSMVRPRKSRAERKAEEEARRLQEMKEQFALRDVFAAQVAAERAEQGLKELSYQQREAAAAELRSDYVDSVHVAVSQVRQLSSATWYIGLLGIVLAVVARELEFNNPGDASMASIVLGVRCCNTLVTGLLLYLIYLLHQNEFKVECMNAGYLSDLPRGFQTERNRHFAYEVLICIVHDFPFANWLLDVSIEQAQVPYLQAYFWTEYVYEPAMLQSPYVFIMVLRLYLLIRHWRDARFGPNANILSIFSNFSFNSDFALRAIMDSDALTTLLKFLMIMIFCMSYIIHLCERTITPTFYTDGTFTVAQGHWTQSYFAAIWITFFSFTTLGYGDILPITYCGRAASMMTVILGILLVSGLTGAFNMLLTSPPFEQKMMDFMSLVSLRLGRLNSAANTIACAWRYYKMKQKLRVMYMRHKRASTRVGLMSFMHQWQRFRERRRMESEFDDSHRALLLQVLHFSDVRTNLTNYVARFGQTAHLQNLLQRMSNRVQLTANITAGEERDQHINNYIVHQMVLLFGRHVDKHAAAAGSLKPQVMSMSGDVAEEDSELEYETDESDDERLRIELAKSDNQNRLETVVSLHGEPEQQPGTFRGPIKRMHSIHRQLPETNIQRYLQNKELGLPMPAKTKSTNVHFKRADLPKQENVNLNDIDSTTLMSMGKNLSANDISAINSMLDQARARPDVFSKPKPRVRPDRRRRRRLSHHHHHHLHLKLPPPPPEMKKIPYLLQQTTMADEIETTLLDLLACAREVGQSMESIERRMIKVERDVRVTTDMVGIDSDDDDD